MFQSFSVLDGKGSPVVLIHGVGLDHTMWDLVVARLSTEFRVLRYDIVGHGLTPASADRLTYADFSGQLTDVLGAHGIDRIAVVGFSLGALIAQGFTLAHPERVTKLVLLNSACKRNPQQQAGIRSRLEGVIEHGVSSNVEASINRWFTDAYCRAHPEQIDRVAQRIKDNDPAGFIAAYRLFADSGDSFTPRLSEIRVPTLVITGECDVGSTADMSTAIASRIQGSELKIYPRVKHMLPVENADKLSTDLLRFLK